MGKEFTQETFIQMTRGFMPASVTFAAIELGVFDRLAKSGADSATVAKSLKCNQRGMNALLNALASIGLLKKTGQKFTLSPFAREHLVSGSPGYMGNMTAHSGHIMRKWARLPECVRSGKPAPRPESGTKEAKKQHRDFILAMDDNARRYSDLLVGKLDLRGVNSAVDIGGGPGTYAFALARKKKDISVAVYDTPPTCAIAREQIMKHGLQQRVGTIEGDFNKDGLGSGYDLMLMNNILHIYSPAQNKKLIKKGFNALNPGGRLSVVEFALDKSGTSPASGALFAINMLVNTETGSSYPSDEIKSWMTAAGFKSFEIIQLDPAVVAIIGKKPVAKKGRK